ncbi:hypothetical protein Nepgr_006664 [Nepenthes gracilis]|uniref:Uncharacterized protein n=1 Tax=Nepenthes gracilis TaxID=150966 RepID=A0AAD3S5S6_NEPGR|nr:hypothetical protein Nepgr_006664 [Nepenthes gracilis]
MTSCLRLVYLIVDWGCCSVVDAPFVGEGLIFESAIFVNRVRILLLELVDFILSSSLILIMWVWSGGEAACIPHRLEFPNDVPIPRWIGGFHFLA